MAIWSINSEESCESLLASALLGSPSHEIDQSETARHQNQYQTPVS